MNKVSGANFNQVVKGKNFMTPDVIGYYQQGSYIAELSFGTDMYGQPLYGVTVVNLNTKTHNTELSKVSLFRKEALEYIENLG